jgi:thiol-disulfide isomerase/thioredoxin
MTVSRMLRTAGLAMVLGLTVQSSTLAADSPPNSEFARDFSLLVPPVPAPLEVFTDLGGARVRLADFEGRFLLVNFWATWCAPCVREMPALERLQAKLADEGLHVLAVSIDRGGAKVVEPFAARLGLTGLPLYLDPKSALARAFGIAGLPTTFLIDAEGQVIRALSGAAEWDSDEAVELIRFYLTDGGDKSDVQNAGAQ